MSKHVISPKPISRKTRETYREPGAVLAPLTPSQQRNRRSADENIQGSEGNKIYLEDNHIIVEGVRRRPQQIFPLQLQESLMGDFLVSIPAQQQLMPYRSISAYPYDYGKLHILGKSPLLRAFLILLGADLRDLFFDNQGRRTNPQVKAVIFRMIHISTHHMMGFSEISIVTQATGDTFHLVSPKKHQSGLEEVCIKCLAYLHSKIEEEYQHLGVKLAPAREIISAHADFIDSLPFPFFPLIHDGKFFKWLIS